MLLASLWVESLSSTLAIPFQICYRYCHFGRRQDQSVQILKDQLQLVAQRVNAGTCWAQLGSITAKSEPHKLRRMAPHFHTKDKIGYQRNI